MHTDFCANSYAELRAVLCTDEPTDIASDGHPEPCAVLRADKPTNVVADSRPELCADADSEQVYVTIGRSSSAPSQPKFLKHGPAGIFRV